MNQPSELTENSTLAELEAKLDGLEGGVGLLTLVRGLHARIAAPFFVKNLHLARPC